jgi:hypothetical protein
VPGGAAFLRPLSFLRELVSMTLGEASRGNAKHSQLSFVLAGRRSSIPETVVMDTTGRGVLDTPQGRGMTTSYAAMLLLLAILIPASPAFAEPCSRPAARSKIVEALPLASEQRPVNITFRTHADGVKLSLGLKSKYPDDMTIILQHDFEQLNIKEDRFEVLLRLMGARERLSVPFAAIKAFWDKSELKCSDG